MARKQTINRSEESLHRQICEFIEAQYPQVIFNTDLSGVKLPIGLASKVSKLRSSKSFPDISIYEPNKDRYGLFLEVKKETPWKIDGSLKRLIKYEKINGIKIRYDHYEDQWEMILKLRSKGYWADFVWDLNQAINTINDYMSLK